MIIAPDVESVNPAELTVVLEALRVCGQAPRLALDGAPTRVGGGFWAEIWRLDLRDQGDRLPPMVVLRLAPDPDAATWETAVQGALADAGYPTPRIHADGPPTPGTRAWSVMDYSPGRSMLTDLSGLGALARFPRLARALPDQLAQAAARLHGIDAGPIARDLERRLGRPVEIDQFVDRLGTGAAELGHQLLVRTVQYLKDNQPPVGQRVMCHGDLHPFNVLCQDGGYVVLDWTAAQIADPAYDVAYTSLLISRPPLTGPAAVQPMFRAAARHVARRFVQRYEHHTGRQVDRAQLAWNRAVHSTRILLEVAQWQTTGALVGRSGHPWLSLQSHLEQELRTLVA